MPEKSAVATTQGLTITWRVYDEQANRGFNGVSDTAKDLLAPTLVPALKKLAANVLDKTVQGVMMSLSGAIEGIPGVLASAVLEILLGASDDTGAKLDEIKSKLDSMDKKLDKVINKLDVMFKVNILNALGTVKTYIESTAREDSNTENLKQVALHSNYLLNNIRELLTTLDDPKEVWLYNWCAQQFWIWYNAIKILEETDGVKEDYQRHRKNIEDHAISTKKVALDVYKKLWKSYSDGIEIEKGRADFYGVHAESLLDKSCGLRADDLVSDRLPPGGAYPLILPIKNYRVQQFEKMIMVQLFMTYGKFTKSNMMNGLERSSPELQAYLPQYQEEILVRASTGTKCLIS